MSSFLFQTSFELVSHHNSIPKLHFSNTHSFSVYKSTKKLKLSPVSVSYQEPQPLKSQSKRNQLWVSLPSAVQGVGYLLKSYLEKWGSLFRSFKARDEESSDFYGERLVFLQSGGIGMTLLSVTSNAKVRISPFIATLAANPTFVSGVLAWMSAQSMKIVLNFFVEKKWDFRILFASGGMPSSHTALCTALTTSVALCHGVADSLFPVCLGFSLIVMYDAIGVRRHAGMQAEVLNMIIADLFQGHPISQRKLKELLGHTPSQVLAGAFLGILVACIWCQRSLVPA